MFLFLAHHIWVCGLSVPPADILTGSTNAKQVITTLQSENSGSLGNIEECRLIWSMFVTKVDQQGTSSQGADISSAVYRINKLAQR